MPKMPKQRTELERMIDDLVATGGKLEVAADQDEVASAHFVLCVLAEPRKLFPDNVFDFCTECGVKVQLRPHVPAGPKRICYGCMKRLGLTGNPLISQQTADDLARYRRRN